MNPERSIRNLVVDVLGELERLHYSEATRTGYQRLYRRLIDFADSTGEGVYSESLGNRFLKSIYKFDLGSYIASSHRPFRNQARCIRVLGITNSMTLFSVAGPPELLNRGRPSSPRRSDLA